MTAVALPGDRRSMTLKHSHTHLAELCNQASVNPLQMLVARMTTLPNDEVYSFQRVVYETTIELLNSTLDTHANIEHNHDVLVLVQDIVDRLPKIVEVTKNKLTVPVFDEIEVLDNDTQEIKKFIRKANYEFTGYYCNHKVSDEKCDKFASNTISILDMDEYKRYQQFLDDMSKLVAKIRWHDERMHKSFDERCDLPQPSKIEKIVNCVTTINGKIMEYNATMNPHCSRCEAYLRKYNYVLKEVARMRKEEQIVQQRREELLTTDVKQKPATIPEFINEHFNGIDRFKLSEVKESYKKLYGITKTLQQIKDEIESMGGYKVSNCKGTQWATKL